MNYCSKDVGMRQINSRKCESVCGSKHLNPAEEYDVNIRISSVPGL